METLSIKDLKKILPLCKITKSTKGTYYAFYPLNKEDVEKGIKDLSNYIISNVNNSEIIGSQIKHINYYKGTGVKDSSHYKLEFKIDA